LNCPKNALCLGGSMIQQDLNYWRGSTFSDIIIKCPINNVCLKIDDGVFPNQCLPGHKGPLCIECENGFSKATMINKCEPCGNFSLYNTLTILAKIIFFLVYNSYIVSSRTAKGNEKTSEKEPLQILSVIIVDQLNLLFIILSINGALEQGLGSLLTLFNFGTTVVTDQVISFECFLVEKKFITHDYPLVFSRFLFALFLPFFQMIVMTFTFCFRFLFEYAMFKMKQSKNKPSLSGLKLKLLPTFLVIIMNLYTNLVWNFVQVINCRKLYTNIDKKFLYFNPSVECWGEEYLKFFLKYAIFYLVIWVAGIPAFILILLTSKRNSINYFLGHRLSIVKNIGLLPSKLDELIPPGSMYFLFFSFKKNRYWWFLIVLSWKLVLAFVVNFVPVEILIFLLIFIFGSLIAIYRFFDPYPFHQITNFQIGLFFLNMILVFSIGLLSSESDEKNLGIVIFYTTLIVMIFYVLYIIAEIIKLKRMLKMKQRRLSNRKQPVSMMK
jgi:hypothetical protein